VLVGADWGGRKARSRHTRRGVGGDGGGCAKVRTDEEEGGQKVRVDGD
jgi:hypothetical protein